VFDGGLAAEGHYAGDGVRERFETVEEVFDQEEEQVEGECAGAEICQEKWLAEVFVGEDCLD